VCEGETALPIPIISFHWHRDCIPSDSKLTLISVRMFLTLALVVLCCGVCCKGCLGRAPNLCNPFPPFPFSLPFHSEKVERAQRGEEWCVGDTLSEAMLGVVVVNELS
jgi:hypothetical protein